MAIFAINSVLSQSLLCTEIIVVDDGSTDGSADFLRANFHDQAELISIYSIDNSGASEARNFGVLKCTSEWVAFLDSDDMWYSNKIEIQLSEISLDPAICLIGTLTTMRNFQIFNFDRKSKLNIINLKTLLFKNFFQTSTVLLRREVLQKLGGFPIGRRYAEEGDLFLRVAAKHKCVLVNEVLVDYSGGKSGFGEVGLSANLLQMELGEIKNICSAWQRGDSKNIITGLALIYSAVKFLRRCLIRSKNNVFLYFRRFF